MIPRPRHPRPAAATSAATSAATTAATAALALVALAAALLAGCGGVESRAEPAPPGAPRDTATLDAQAVALAGLETAVVDSQPWRDAWTVPARLTVDPAATQTLGSFVEGRVKDVFVRPGDAVRAGQVLVTIHSHEMNDARAALGRARAGMTEAEDGLRLATAGADRAERLYAIRALSQADLERARSARVQARARQSEAAAELERASSYVEHLVGSGPLPRGADDHDVLIRSPIAGTVVGREALPGAVVLPGATLVTVSRLGTLMLRVPVPERALAAAHPGNRVRFTVPAWPGRTFEARVTRVSPVVDSLSRTVEVLAAVADAGAALKPEMYASAELEGAGGTRALAVPAAAVQLLEGDTVVVTARPVDAARGGGLALEAVPVRVGRRTARIAELVRGVPAGTRVVTTGAAIAKAELLERRGGGGE